MTVDIPDPAAQAHLSQRFPDGLSVKTIRRIPLLCPVSKIAYEGYGRVRISAPDSVTTSVCSNWAVRLRSFVTTVQPSSHMS